MKSRVPVYCSFISCDKNKNTHAIVNNVPHPKIKPFSSSFFHKAKHESLLQLWKPDDLQYKKCCLRLNFNFCAFLAVNSVKPRR